MAPVGCFESLHAAIAASLLAMMTFAMSIFVMIRGVTSYSGELRSRSAYLIFMTPNSTRKIMASKFLFTLALSAFFALVYIGLGYLHIRLLLDDVRDPHRTTPRSGLVQTARWPRSPSSTDGTAMRVEIRIEGIAIARWMRRRSKILPHE